MVSLKHDGPMGRRVRRRAREEVTRRRCCRPIRTYGPTGQTTGLAVNFCFSAVNLTWGLAAGYQPHPQVVDRGTTARYGGQLQYIKISSREPRSWAAGRASGL